MNMFARITLLAAPMLAISAIAMAQPALLASTPAKDAVVARTGTIQLNFDKPVAAGRSKADLVMTAMPGMANMPTMRMPVKIGSSADKKGLVLTARTPLPAGTYKLNWTAADEGGSTAAGTLPFSVR